MDWLKKRKIKKLRDEITADAELLPDQKEMALQRLDEKEQQLFSSASVAMESQKLFTSLLPTIVGKVQVKRLQTRNEMIREMRITLNELAETKKSWERLRNIDAEIAADQAMAYLEHQTKQAELHDKKTGFNKSRRQKELEMEKAELEHEREIIRLKAELEAEKKKHAAPPREKTREEIEVELAREHAIELKRLEY